MFVGLVVFFAVVRTFFFSPFLVEGDSMLPGLKSGDVFLVDRLTYRSVDPARDDVVVFYLNEDPKYFYVKRIIGLPGERLHLEKDGVDLVAATGARQRLVEPFLMPDPHPSEKFLSDANELGQDFTVPAGKYFMMGDNREHSKDSRFFREPFVPRKNLAGKFWFRLGNFEEWWAGAGADAGTSVDAGDEQHLPMRKLDIFRDAGVSQNAKNSQQQAIANFNVQVADTPAERETGLMYRTKMPADEGMIFLFDSAQPLTFWMKNTLIPLDIIFMDENWRVVSIQKNAQPCKADPCALYPSAGATKYVLEINAGLSDKLNIQKGDPVQM